jgi:putative redox protein
VGLGVKKADKSEPSVSSIVRVKWIDGLRFVATDSGGHSLVMDVSKQSGGEGSGFSPVQLLLIALGGCTGMDVADIMRKQRQQIEGLEILVSGERVKEPPRIYSNIHVEYRIKGKNIKENAVQRAIKLSEDKYCSVGATLKAKAKLTSNYVIQ